MRTKYANISNVFGRIWTGGDLAYLYDQAAAQVAEIVNDAGITTVIDVRKEAQDHEVWEQVPTVTYLTFPVADKGFTLPKEFWKDGIAAVSEAFDRPGDILIHCHMGVNRAPSLAALALIELCDLQPEKAFDHVHRCRPLATCLYLPNGMKHMGFGPGHCQRVKEYIAARVDLKNVDRAIRAIHDHEATGTRTTNSVWQEALQ